MLMRHRDRATIIAEREQASSGSGREWGEQHRRADGQPIDHVGAQRRRWGSGCGGGIGKRCQKMGHSRARAGRVGSEAERDRWVRRTPKSKSGGCSGGGDWEAVMTAKASRRLLKKGMQTPKKVESGSSANRSNNGPEQSESREQVERETKDRCRERASKIGKPAWPTDGQYKVDKDNTGVDVVGVRKEVRDQGERKMSRAA